MFISIIKNVYKHVSVHCKANIKAKSVKYNVLDVIWNLVVATSKTVCLKTKKVME